MGDVAAKDDIDEAVGALEGEARGGFISDDAVEGAAIFCFDGVAKKVRRDLAIRIENIDEDLFRIPLPNRGEVWTNILAEITSNGRDVESPARTELMTALRRSARTHAGTLRSFTPADGGSHLMWTAHIPQTT